MDLELEENRLTAEAIAMMDEESLERLYKYLIGCLEEEAHLTAEKRAQLATQAMAQVWMPPTSGPAGADQFVRPYEKAYLLELRAGLVITNEVVTAQRLFNYKEKLAPEVRQYLKSLPESEQPASLQAMHRAVRKWADIQREGQTRPKKGSWEDFGALGEEGTKRERRAKAKADKKKEEEAETDAAGARSAEKRPISELIAQTFAAHAAEFFQNLAKKSEGKGNSSPSDRRDWSKEKCKICGGKHLAQLRGKAYCPNTVAEENGTAEANLEAETRCTHWVDRNRTECGGSHSFEDHKAA